MTTNDDITVPLRLSDLMKLVPRSQLEKAEGELNNLVALVVASLVHMQDAFEVTESEDYKKFITVFRELAANAGIRIRCVSHHSDDDDGSHEEKQEEIK